MIELKCDKTGLTGLFCASSKDEKHQQEQIKNMIQMIKLDNEREVKCLEKIKHN